MKPIYVVKRDGSREILDITKVQTQIERACDGITNVSESMIELRASIEFEEGMTTRTIDQLLLRAMVDLIDMEANPATGHVNYQYVAGKQRLRMLRKDVYGQYYPKRLFEIVKSNIENGSYTSALIDWYSEEEWDQIQSFIDHSKDEKYSYSALEQLIEKYLVQNRVTKQVYESPQVRYAVAAATAFHMESKKNRLAFVRDYYQAASEGHFTLSTPVLAGLGTPTTQFSSCTLISAGDSLDSIFATGEMMAKYAAKRAGIGLEIGKLRALDAPIRGGEIKHTGIVPFLKKWFADLRSCCLRPDMMVEIHIEEGITKRIPISEVEVGMKIKSFDGGEISFNRVSSKMETEVLELNQVRLEFENGAIVHCSTNHPIMVMRDSVEEVSPLTLTEDDRVITPVGFTSLLSKEIIQNNDTTYIDIEVEGTHTFFTSHDSFSEQILTHNSQGGIRNACVERNTFIEVIDKILIDGVEHFPNDKIMMNGKEVYVRDII